MIMMIDCYLYDLNDWMMTDDYYLNDLNDLNDYDYYLLPEWRLHFSYVIGMTDSVVLANGGNNI
jgi:hypothetical protein